MKRCIYCDFVSNLYNPQKAESYIRALKKEISGIKRNAPISTLYIGGGTPTALDTETLKNFLDHVFEHFRFSENYEATIEANPGTLNSDKLHMIRSTGINRISIGVQSFNDNELSFLGRMNTSEEAEEAVALSRDADLKNISIDLIYGIPGQTLESWKMTLKKAAGLKPCHISTYELTPEKGTLLYNYLNNPPSTKLTLPEEDRIIEMYNHTIEHLASAGFLHYEISNFAIPGYFCRHNLNYWDRNEYYGIGLGAHSFIGETRYSNTGNLEEYITMLDADKRPVKDTEHLSKETSLSEAIFLGLRKVKGIDLADFERKYGTDLLVSFKNEIMELMDAVLIEFDSKQHHLRLTKKGLVLSNEVFQRFL